MYGRQDQMADVWNDYHVPARSRRLNRRRLLVRGTTLASGGAMAFAMACSSSTSNNANTPAGSSASAGSRSSTPPSGPAGTAAAASGTAAAASTAPPKQGGTAITLYEYDPPTVDVHTQSASQAQWFASSIYSSIVRYEWQKPWTVGPDLAKSWEASPDGLQYTFHLNQGVKWSDGSDFSAADAAFNLQKVTSDTVAPQSAAFGQLLAPVLDQITTPDAGTLVVQLKSPFPALLAILAGNAARIYKKEIYDKDLQEKQYIGTGPYVLKQYEKGQLIEYARNPQFFKPGLPHLDGLKRLYIPTVPAEVSALSIGQIMVNTLWPGLAPSQLKTIQAAAGNKARLLNLPENSMEKVFVNVTQPPFNDQRVRQAINLTLDRQEVLNRALEGAGVIGTLDPRESPDYALSLDDVAKLPGYRQPKDQDIADAKKLLEAAGHATGLDFELLVRATASYVPIAQVVQQSLAKAGIRAKINQVEAAAGIVAQTQGNFAMGIVGGGSTFSDPFLALHVQMTVGGAKFSTLNDPNIDGAINKGLTTIDSAERQKIAKAVQTYIATTDTASFPIAWDTSGIVIWSQLQGYYPATDMNQGMDLQDAWLA